MNKIIVIGHLGRDPEIKRGLRTAERRPWNG